jgi:hypothetical protein
MIQWIEPIAGTAVLDPGWPDPLDTQVVNEPSDGMLEQLRNPIPSHWTDHRPDPIVN